MEEKNKIFPEELEKLKNLQSQYFKIIDSLGNIEIQIMDLENLKADLKKELISLREEESNFTKELETKYGEGKISLDTGEVMPLDE